MGLAVTFDDRFERFVMREAEATVRAFARAGIIGVPAEAVAAAAVVVGLDIALRAAVVDPAAAEVLRDRLADVVHFAPDADTRGADESTAAALRFLELAR